jgi:hypothetical protein
MTTNLCKVGRLERNGSNSPGIGFGFPNSDEDIPKRCVDRMLVDDRIAYMDKISYGDGFRHKLHRLRRQDDHIKLYKQIIEAFSRGRST